MHRRLVPIAAMAVLVLSLTACVMEFDNAGTIVSGAVKKYSETVELQDKYQTGQPIQLQLDMKMAKAKIGSTEDKLAEAEFEYGSDALKPEFKTEEDRISIRNTLDKYSFGKIINDWKVKVTDKVPLEVELTADASDADMDMGGMLIKKMSAQVNASSMKIDFSEPNKESLDKFRLDADASNISIDRAGNIGFKVMDIGADASKIIVDLTGENESEGEVRLDTKASTVRLKLPEDVGIRIVIDNYELSSVKITNNKILSRSEKEYVSSNYEESEKTLRIYADLNVTTLFIE